MPDRTDDADASSLSVGAQLAREATRRYLAEADRVDAEIHERLARTRGRRRGNGASVVFTVRLAPDELAALERRASQQRIRPSVLARNLIRRGITVRSGRDLDATLDRIEDAVAELREGLS